MDLIPKELKEKIPKLYETEEQENPTAYIKLFMPDANWTWFITELSIDNNICFGYVISSFGSELGYFSLQEVQEVKGSLGLGIERDEQFQPTKLSEVKRLYDV